jgi:beta-glucosidase
MKLVWKNLAARIWLLVAATTLIIVFVATMVATQVPLLSETISIVLGRKRPIIDQNNEAKLYEADYDNKADVLAAAKSFNIQIEEEGIILLKNTDSALPIAKGSRISVFGKNSEKFVYSGSGSGGAAGSDSVGLFDGLNDAQLVVNPALRSFYQNRSASGSGRPANPDMGEKISGFATGETPLSSYTQTVKDSYSGYSDAAIVVISRIGGEGFDLPRTMLDGKGNIIAGAKSGTDHYLQLDQNETDMLDHVCGSFDKVILLLNTPTALELGFLEDSAYANVKSVLWVGYPGSTGASAIGRVLNGEVNPSGRTTNTYARDFKKDPTWQNFGDNRVANGNRYTVDGANQNAYFVDYEESIFIGYRYYETRAAEIGGSWYDDNVVFPFGFGLSYTSFDWEVLSSAPAANAQLSANGEIKVTVRVTNTGTRVGKDVVQLYFTAPYTNGGIEKSFVSLGAFEKTALIQPGGHDDVELVMSVYDMASYDWNDANHNAFKGYEVEAGSYKVKVMKNSHTAASEIGYTVPAGGFMYRNDPVTGNEVVNRFDTVSSHIDTYLTRADFTGANPASFPTVPTVGDRAVSKSLIDSLGYSIDFSTDDDGKPWFSNERFKQEQTVSVVFEDLIGADYDDLIWETILNQLSVKEMAEFVASGSFGSNDIEKLGKPMAIDSDGPSGLTNFMAIGGEKTVYDTCAYVTECVIGATWNKELAYEMGKMVGNESLIGDEKHGGMPYSGWYAPAVNLYRSPFSGRNWEYYGEDGLLTGKIGASVVKGAMEKGMYAFVKHFAVNDQETDRDTNGLITWASEQAMRELYFKPFEIIVKEGKTTAMMSSFNRIGTTWAGGSHELLTEVLRDEWGFRGFVVTDYAVNSYLRSEQMIRAGGDLLLMQLDNRRVPNYENPTPTQVAVLRKATKNILYTTVNSNLMNVKVLGYKLPVWQILLIVLNVVLFVGFAVWGFFVIRRALKKKKPAPVPEDSMS